MLHRAFLYCEKESLLAWRRFVEKHTPDSVEDNIEAAGSVPLFDVRLKVVTGDGGTTCVSIVPGLPEIENSLACIVNDVVTAVKVRQPPPHSLGYVVSTTKDHAVETLKRRRDFSFNTLGEEKVVAPQLFCTEVLARNVVLLSCFGRLCIFRPKV